MEINHKEAHLYASMHEGDSNLARCYLALEKRIAELEAAQQQRALDGAKYCPECGQGVVGFLGKCEICGYNPPRQ